MFYNYSIINKKKAKTIKHISKNVSSSTVAINKHREENNTFEKHRPRLLLQMNRTRLLSFQQFNPCVFRFWSIKA